MIARKPGPLESIEYSVLDPFGYDSVLVCHANPS